MAASPSITSRFQVGKRQKSMKEEVLLSIWENKTCPEVLNRVAYVSNCPPLACVLCLIITFSWKRRFINWVTCCLEENWSLVSNEEGESLVWQFAVTVMSKYFIDYSYGKARIAVPLRNVWFCYCLTYCEA